MSSGSQKFKTKTFISFSISLSFLIMAFSGVILFLRPEGSIAHWTDWSVLGLDKKGWEGVHAIFTALFIILATWHLVFNWRVLLHYLKGSLKKDMHHTREISLAVIMVLFFMFASVIQMQPFWKLMDIRGDIKSGDSKLTVIPPSTYTKETTINELAVIVKMPAKEILYELKEKGYIVVDPDDKFSLLAEKNNISPEKLFMEIHEITH
ncbi:DUF4405 domain-containing protein [candidate division KSB1 bacterium]